MYFLYIYIFRNHSLLSVIFSTILETVKNSHVLDITKLAFEFLVLTAGRSGEIRWARWDEIDGNKWEIPKERMKKKKPHRVPLSNRCMEILALIEPMQDGSGLLFSKNGKPLSDMTLSRLMESWAQYVNNQKADVIPLIKNNP